MKQKIARFMYGRNGADQFNRALSVLTLILLVVSSFFEQTARSFMLVVVLALIIYVYFRMFSKNLSARREENIKYLQKTAKIRNELKLRREMWKQRKEYKFFKCTSCKAVMRVPKGKGKIRIICKKCGTAFERKT